MQAWRERTVLQFCKAKQGIRKLNPAIRRSDGLQRGCHEVFRAQPIIGAAGRLIEGCVKRPGFRRAFVPECLEAREGLRIAKTECHLLPAHGERVGLRTRANEPALNHPGCNLGAITASAVAEAVCGRQKHLSIYTAGRQSLKLVRQLTQ